MRVLRGQASLTRIRMWIALGLIGSASATACAQKQEPVPVPPAPLAGDAAQPFHDKHYGVRFEVPAGWSFAQKDKQLSTFHMDARSAAPRSEMRGVAMINFNPFPLSVFSGALFYFSVQKHTNDHECALQAYSFGEAARSTEDIGGMNFQHGHDEHGKICVESRDEVYTAYRKGSCYRFDLAVNTFCSVSSGAQELSVRQMDELEKRMGGILSSVVLDWRPARAHEGPKESPGRRPMTTSETHAGSLPTPSAAR